MTYTALQIVEKYLALRNYVKARTDEFQKIGATEADQELIARARAASKAEDPTDFLTTSDCRDIAQRLEQLLTPMSEYTGAMEALEALADSMMTETKQKALSTESGTAFRVNKQSVTCADPAKFLDWVFQFNARNFLTSHVAKDPVIEYMEGPGEGHPPPGVKVTPVTEIQFRKA